MLDTFYRKRLKLAEALQNLESTKEAFTHAQSDRNPEAIAKASIALAKAETASGKARSHLDALLEEDQEPFVQGKHPGVALKSAWALLPEHRGRQSRWFPSVSPHDPNVFMRFAAPADEIAQHWDALTVAASRVVRLGHSASLVSCSIVDQCPRPTWEPNESGEDVLRVLERGQLGRLEHAFAHHQEVEPRVLPCRFQRYSNVTAAPEQPSPSSCFGEDWIVFRQIRGLRLSQTSCVEFARALRGALMKYADDPPPELLSGHTEGGSPSQKAHLAFVPLPFVGSRYATGDLLGAALVFPRTTDEGERHAVLHAIARWEATRRAEEDDQLVDVPPLRLWFGKAGVIDVERLEWGVAPLKTLRSDTWCRRSRAWVTATPIALDRNPGDLSSRDPGTGRAAAEAAKQSIIASCERIGLPKPAYVEVHPSVPVTGGAKARAFPAFPADPQKHHRVKVHARIEFSLDVSGPLLLGAGRYFGLGLCLPQPKEASVV